MKRVVFFGNCQAIAVFDRYRSIMHSLYNYDVKLVKCFESLSDEGRRTVEEADLIVEQVFDFPQFVSLDSCNISAPIIRFPTVCLGFLWPNASRSDPHPRNEGIAYRPQGPYSPEDSDVYLNREIRKEQPPDQALAAYLSEDLSAAAQRRYELFMDQQRHRDAQTGFSVAGEMEKRFREEHLFATPYHPRLPFSRYFITEVLSRLDVPRGPLESVVGSMRESAFPRGELPVHPSVARAFGLKWCNPEYGYVTFTGERKTFCAYFAAYLRYDWNEPLTTALVEARRPNLSEQEAGNIAAALKSALAAGSGSAEGYRVLGDLLSQTHNVAGASEAYEQSIAMDPADRSPSIALAEILSNTKPQEASAVLEQAIAIQPLNPDLHMRQARLLHRLGRREAAIRSALRSVELSPGYVWFGIALADFLAAQEDGGRILQTHASNWPNTSAPWITLGHYFEKRNQQDEVLGVYRRATEVNSNDSNAWRFYGIALVRNARYAAGEVALRNAISLAEHDDGMIAHHLSRALFAQGRATEAISFARQAVERNPTRAAFREHVQEVSEALP